MRACYRVVPASLFLIGALVVAGCGGQGSVDTGARMSSPTSPGSSGVSGGLATVLGGQWASSPTGASVSPDSCGDFAWNITALTPTSASGTFSATCAGGVRVAGNASGTLNGTVVNWRVDGAGTDAGGQPCQFALSGTGSLEGTGAINVQYTGTVCGTPVGGNTVWRRR